METENQEDQGVEATKFTLEEREELIEDMAIKASNNFIRSAYEASNEQMRVNQIEVSRRVGVKIIASVIVNETINAGDVDKIQEKFGDFQKRLAKQVQKLLQAINSGEAEFVPAEDEDETSDEEENKH